MIFAKNVPNFRSDTIEEHDIKNIGILKMYASIFISDSEPPPFLLKKGMIQSFLDISMVCGFYTVFHFLRYIHKFGTSYIINRNIFYFYFNLKFSRINNKFLKKYLKKNIFKISDRNDKQHL